MFATKQSAWNLVGRTACTKLVAKILINECHKMNRDLPAREDSP